MPPLNKPMPTIQMLRASGTTVITAENRVLDGLGTGWSSALTAISIVCRATRLIVPVYD